MAQQDEVDFDKAFGEAAVAAEKDVQTGTETPPPEVAKEPAAAVAADDKAAQDAAAKVEADKKAADDKAAADAAAKVEADKKAADDKAAADAAAQTPEAKEAQVKAAADEAAKAEADKKAADEKAAADARIKAEAEARANAEVTARQRVEAEAKEKADIAAKDEERRKALDAELQPYEFNEEEKKAHEQFKKDFPTEALAVEARFKQVERIISQRVYNGMQAVLQLINKDVVPFVKQGEEQALAAHLEAVHKAHPDYDEVVDLIPAWIKQQPAYLQAALQQAYDEGDTASVIDLTAQFKSSTGRAKSATPTPPAHAAPAKPGPTEAEIAAGMTVAAKRSTPTAKGSVDPNDYDGAFAEAAASK